jgi:Ca2+-transporting ATPase
VFASVLAVDLWCVWSYRPDDVVRSVTFSTLVLGNLSLIVVNRSWRLSIWRTFRERRNRALPWILGGASVLLVALLSVPALRQAFALGPVNAVDWLVAVVAGFAGVLWFEVYKQLTHR